MKRAMLLTALFAVLLTANVAALNWPPQTSDDCEPRWTPANGEEELVWADQMRECAFCFAEQPACQFGPNPPSKPSNEVPEFGTIAGAIAVVGAGAAYLRLRKRK